MARSSRTKTWQHIRGMAWDRDKHNKAVCHICGEPIDYSLPPSSAPLSWEPDHLLPVSIAPELEFDLLNIAPSHMSCNRRRGAGDGVNDIGRRSRVW